MYYPPAGWRCGFPKQYLPEPGEEIEDTLLRDGYPHWELNKGMARYVRFWDEFEEVKCEPAPPRC